MSKKKAQNAQQSVAEMPQKPTSDELLSHYLYDLHYEVKGIKNYFTNIYDTVKFYLDKYGPYLPTDDRKKLALLAFKADEIMLDVYGLTYQIDIIYGEAQANIDNDTPDEFHVDDKEVKELHEAVTMVENAIAEFVDEFKAMINELKKKAERDGMY